MSNLAVKCHLFMTLTNMYRYSCHCPSVWRLINKLIGRRRGWWGTRAEPADTRGRAEWVIIGKRHKGLLHPWGDWSDHYIELAFSVRELLTLLGFKGWMVLYSGVRAPYSNRPMPSLKGLGYKCRLLFTRIHGNCRLKSYSNEVMNSGSKETYEDASGVEDYTTTHISIDCL